MPLERDRFSIKQTIRFEKTQRKMCGHFQCSLFICENDFENRVCLSGGTLLFSNILMTKSVNDILISFVHNVKYAR